MRRTDGHQFFPSCKHPRDTGLPMVSIWQGARTGLLTPPDNQGKHGEVTGARLPRPAAAPAFCGRVEPQKLLILVKIW